MEKIEKILDADDKILWSGRANDEVKNRRMRKFRLGMLFLGFCSVFVCILFLSLPCIYQEFRMMYERSPGIQYLINIFSIFGIVGSSVIIFFTYKFYKRYEIKVYDLIYAIYRKNIYITASEIKSFSSRWYPHDYYIILEQYLEYTYFEKGILFKEGNVIFLPQEKVEEIYIRMGPSRDQVGFVSSIDGKQFRAFSFEYLDNSNDLRKVFEEHFSFELSGSSKYHSEIYKRKKIEE